MLEFRARRALTDLATLTPFAREQFAAINPEHSWLGFLRGRTDVAAEMIQLGFEARGDARRTSSRTWPKLGPAPRVRTALQSPGIRAS